MKDFGKSLERAEKRKTSRYHTDPARKEYNKEHSRKTMEHYQFIRTILIVLLGGRCAVDGCPRTDLTLDHPHGRDYCIHSMNAATRVRRYIDDLKTGNLRVLCNSHNASLRPITLPSVMAKLLPHEGKDRCEICQHRTTHTTGKPPICGAPGCHEEWKRRHGTTNTPKKPKQGELL